MSNISIMKLELYQVSSHIREVLDELEALELPEEVIRDTIEGISGTLEQKAIDIVAYANNLEAEARAVKEAKQELANRQSMLERKAQNLKNSLASILHNCNIKKVHSELYDVNVQLNPPKLSIINEELIPGEYFRERVIREPDAAKIKAAILEHCSVPGCEITRSLGLRIR
jgi:chromosome segregation ATPase